MTSSRRRLLGGLAGTVGLAGLGAVAYRTASGRTGSPRPDALVAGSLLHLAEAVPGASVEARGSAAVRRLILNDLRSPDAVAVADPVLLDGISDRATLFATNALVLAYSPSSPYAEALKRDWRGAVERDGLTLGRTDPTADPLGYRTVMALQLAESRSDVAADAVLDGSRIFRETELLTLVANGKVDAAFAYRNMAVQSDVPYVSLPDAIDFSNPEHADGYETVAYDIGERTVRGAPIRYAATALTDAGESWIEALVTSNDRLRENGFVVPAAYPQRDVALASD